MRCIVQSDGLESGVIRNGNQLTDDKSSGARCPGWSTACFFLLCLVILSGCGGPWRDQYLSKGVKRLSQDDIAEKLGPPSTAKTPVLGGDTVWTYRVPMGDREVHPWDPSSLTTGKRTKAPASPSPFGKSLAGAEEPYREPLYCYRYTLSFGEDKRLKDWKREECIPRVSEDEAASQ